MDNTGPLQKSEGFKYILLNGDQFSNFYEVELLLKQEAKTADTAFVNHWNLSIPVDPCSARRDHFSCRNFQKPVFRNGNRYN